MAGVPESCVVSSDWGGGPVAIVALHGEHDVSTRADVVSALDAATDDAHGVVVDLTDTAFLDFTLAGLIADRAQELAARGGRLALLVPADTASVVHRVLELAGVSAVLTIATSRAAVLAAACTARAVAPAPARLPS